jgi:hypothetical protein
MHIDAPATRVFPFLCPVRENDWIPGWKETATIIHSESGVAELGAVFQTRREGEPETWVVSTYEPNERIAFTRFGGDVAKRLVIDLTEKEGRTRMLWTTYQVGTSEAGNANVEATSAEAYRATYAGLEKMLQHYLDTGEMIPAETLHRHA